MKGYPSELTGFETELAITGAHNRRKRTHEPSFSWSTPSQRLQSISVSLETKKNNANHRRLLGFIRVLQVTHWPVADLKTHGRANQKSREKNAPISDDLCWIPWGQAKRRTPLVETPKRHVTTANRFGRRFLRKPLRSPCWRTIRKKNETNKKNVETIERKKWITWSTESSFPAVPYTDINYSIGHGIFVECKTATDQRVSYSSLIFFHSFAWNSISNSPKNQVDPFERFLQRISLGWKNIFGFLSTSGQQRGYYIEEYGWLFTIARIIDRFGLHDKEA